MTEGGHQMNAGSIRFIPWVVLAVLLQACGLAEIKNVATTEELSQIENSRTFPKNYDAVWAATIKTLAQYGTGIQSQDKSSGIISTDWTVEKEAIGIYTTGSRGRATILIEKLSPSSTRVTVTPVFQIRVASTANWAPTARKKHHVDLEKRLLDDVQKNL